MGEKWWKVARHISSIADGINVGGFVQRLVSRDSATSSSTFATHKVDMLDKCGQLKVDDFVPAFFAGAIRDTPSLFPQGATSLPAHAHFRWNRAEFVLFIRRQIQSNKAVLGRRPIHVADVFTVGKRIRTDCGKSGMDPTSTNWQLIRLRCLGLPFLHHFPRLKRQVTERSENETGWYQYQYQYQYQYKF